MRPPFSLGFSATIVLPLLGVVLLSTLGCSELIPQRSEGEKLYRARCASCHGLDARGNTPRYLSDHTVDLTDDDFTHGGGSEAMGLVIQYGVTGRMPANEDLSPDQIKAIVKHLQGLIEDAQQFD